jgi:hypothetical protein
MFRTGVTGGTGKKERVCLVYSVYRVCLVARAG